jgi:hypothetical protein
MASVDHQSIGLVHQRTAHRLAYTRLSINNTQAIGDNHTRSKQTIIKRVH